MYKKSKILILLIGIILKTAYTSFDHNLVLEDPSEIERRSIFHMLETQDQLRLQYPTYKTLLSELKERKFMALTTHKHCTKMCPEFKEDEYIIVKTLNIPDNFFEIPVHIIEHTTTHQRKFMDLVGRQSHVVAALRYAPSRTNSNVCAIKFYMLEAQGQKNQLLSEKNTFMVFPLPKTI